MRQKKRGKGQLQYRIETIHPSRWNPYRLDELLKEMKGKKILVVGDVGIDRYTHGLVERISPEAPVPIVLVQEEKYKLGLAANVADNVQCLGGHPFLLGVVGQDRFAQDFRDLLHRSTISDSHLVVDASRRTALKERIVSDGQQMVRVDYESLHPIDAQVQKKFLAKFNALLPQVDGVVIEDYAKGILSEKVLQAVIRRTVRAKKWVAVDPNLKTPIAAYRGATLLTPNTKEAESLSGILIRDETSLAQAGFEILKKAQAQICMITRGKEGMAIFFQGSSEIRSIPTFAREVFDVSGAGDTVIATLILSLVSQATLEEAAVLSNLAAGVEVGKHGTATVTPDEIRAAMSFF